MASTTARSWIPLATSGWFVTTKRRKPAAFRSARASGTPGRISRAATESGQARGSSPKHSGLKSGPNCADRYVAMHRCAGLLLLSTLAVAGTRPRSLPLMFEANLGQAEPGTAFLGRGHGYAIH